MISAQELQQTESTSRLPGAGTEAEEASRLLRTGLPLLAWALLLWGAFYLTWRLFPEVTPGSLRVYDAKLAALSQPGLFAPNAPSKVLFVGLSYTITGVKPESFDRMSQGRCSSFNLGMPVTLLGRRVYTLPEILGVLQAAAQPPTDVLITWQEPWPPPPTERPKSLAPWLTPKWDTAGVVRSLFPFRQLARDGSIFLARSLHRGGPLAFRRACNRELESCLRSRGYYFMKTDSIYPRDQLPDNYVVRTDAPNRVMARSVERWEAYIQSLRQAAPGVRLVLLPNYYRANSCAPAPSNAALRRALAPYGVLVLGPDYFQYPNRLFSDPAHLNPAGAEVYTRDLWTLLSDYFNQLPTSAVDHGSGGPPEGHRMVSARW